MWVLKPVLGAMLSELSQLAKLAIQRSVHFSDVYQDSRGYIRFHENTRRSKFVNKE